GFGSCSDDTFFFLAVLKKNQCRNALDSKSLRHGWVIVNVKFDDGRAARIFFGHGFDGRRERAAWRAPHGPEIHQHGTLRTKNVGLKRVVTSIFHMLTHELAPCSLSIFKICSETVFNYGNFSTSS